MYWKCLVLSLLLVSTATWSGVKGEDVRTDDQIIEKIVSDLSLSEKEVPAVSSGHDNTFNSDIKAAPASTPPSKKDAQKKPIAEDNGVHASAGQVMAQQGGHQEGSAAETIFNSDNKIFIVTVSAAGLAGFVGILMAGVCYYKFRRHSKAATEVEYPAYGVTGPNKERVPSPGDRKLAQSAQMYHYQHQKQQMIAMEKANGDMKHDASDDDSEEDNVEGDYTVYECPGLAPTGEMEVKNPLFRGDDMTPVNPDTDITTPPHKSNGDLPHHEEH